MDEIYLESARCSSLSRKQKTNIVQQNMKCLPLSVFASSCNKKEAVLSLRMHKTEKSRAFSNHEQK